MIRPENINEDVLTDFYDIIVQNSNLGRVKAGTDSNLDNLFRRVEEVEQLAKNGEMGKAKQLAADLMLVFGGGSQV